VRLRNRVYTRSAVLALTFSLLAGTVTLDVATARSAPGSAARSALSCASSAVLYRVLDNGDMLRYQHLEPETGVTSWSSNPPTIGRSWAGKPLAAPDGVFYAPWTNGELRRYRWNGTAWDTFAGGGQHEVIATGGWERYLTADFRNRITVDTEGHIYTVEPGGLLHWRSYDPATRTWTHRQLGSGWGQFNLIVAGGSGVIYARNNSGILYRYRYHAASQRWLQTGLLVGRNWQTFDRVIAAGADVLYAIQPDGLMFWYRWDENSSNWVSSTGRQVGAAWLDRSTTAAPDSCILSGSTAPARPAVSPRPFSAPTLRYTTNGDVHYTYVDSEGRAVHAETVDLSGANPIAFAAVPGFSGVTGATSTGEHQDGRLQLVATGTDAEVRGNVQTAVHGSWTDTKSLGGFVPGPATLVRQPDNTLVMIALDENHGLWQRRQVGVNGPFTAWTSVGATPLAAGPLTVVPITSGIRILGLGQDGTFRTATLVNNALSEWTGLGGGGFSGTLSAVVMPDATLQVFATSGGVVQTQRQGGAGFPGTWTPLPGLTVPGSPSAILAPNGALQVAARADDGYIHYAAQVAPGSGAYTPWREVTGYAYQASTEPTALAVPDENTWALAYLDDVGTPKLLRAQLESPTARSTTPFVEVPLRSTG
jgi:hypothetical protein